MPPPSALLNGVIGSVVLFALVSFALVHSEVHPRISTYYNDDFHAGPPPIYATQDTASTSFTPAWVSPARVSEDTARAARYFSSVPILAALDSDHDGILSAEEIAKAPTVLSALDSDHDGKLGADECGYRPPHLRGDTNRPGTLERRIRRGRINYMRLEPVLAALDSDRDTIISPNEIANASAALKTLDRNHDGRLTLDEILRDPEARQVAIIFGLDHNFDGRISPAERQNALAVHWETLLDSADRNGNHDGNVSWEELAVAIHRAAEEKRREFTWGRIARALSPGK